MSEEWRPILGYEGHYEVSDQGHVRSLPRATFGNRLTGKVLSVFLSAGYPAVSMPRKPGGVATIHALVCEAWHGPRAEGMECRHLDGNPLNPSPENLQWGTHAENLRDVSRYGVYYQVARTHCPQGHEYSPENTYSHRKHRNCRTCSRASAARYRIAKRVAA